MKTVFAAAVLATAFTISSPFANVPEANAGVRNDRVVVCDWYRTKAQVAARRGNIDKSDHYWHLFRACMNHRIN